METHPGNVGPLTEMIRPYAAKIQSLAKIGDRRARQVIGLYQMHYACTSDPAAQAFCEAAFDEWLSHAPKTASSDA